MTAETNPSIQQKSPARRLIASIMLVLILWGAYLARGAFLLQRNMLQGSLVLLCVLAFVGFWGLMLLSQKKLDQTGGVQPRASLSPNTLSRYSKASIAGFVSGLSSLLLIVPVDLSTQIGNTRLQLDLSRPGAPLLISAALMGLCLLLSIIGLSRPQPLVGKNLGFCALPTAIVWLCLTALLFSE